MTDRPSPLPPMFLALAAFALFAIGDGIVRSMAGAWPGSAIALVRYAVATVAIGLYLLIRAGRAGFAMPAPWIQLGRGIAIASVGTLFWVSLTYMPLADATAILFTSPVWTALLSVVILREAIGGRQLIFVLLAFGGAMIVLQPNVVAFGFGALLPLGSAVSMACLMMLNRALGARGSVAGNQFWLLLVATLTLIPVTIAGHFSGIGPLFVTAPGTGVIVKCLLIALTGTIGHILLYRATLQVSAAIVAPMTYIQILFAVCIGWFLFAAPPTHSMLFGGAIIIGAGYMLIRTNMQMARQIGETGSTPD
jgi:drug/metabolite transporter (DMT)-like permease